MNTLCFIQNLSMWELLIILLVALLLFGKRLPDVGKSLGKGIVEFKKGLKGIEEEVETQSSGRRDAPAYRPPLTASGEDARVSRVDAVESTPQPHPKPHAE
ncbi:MAG: twin-arginine translocase TatA/TatE family subunit [Phycisphaeraceae bacterium]|nr:twin-arginine translocase TatA/TatE family subunit [Phycisphaerae bacterium]MBX3393537.1 twin-arginine translocase TatA/TatE family subunit [Phycisphaeraceae bacterium]HRJ49298.1 twin-arginine translocase TatA/TatE family subunit [Phycisphaerales bacterium]